MFQVEQGWMAVAPWLLLAAARWFGLLLLMPGLSRTIAALRTRAAAAVLLAFVMMPVLTNSSRTTGAGRSLLECLLLILAELATGAALGIGMRIVFAGLRMAGEVIDHQAGLALSQTFDPAGDEPVTASGQALAWAVMAAFLLRAPAGGDVQIVASMLDLFAALPPGAGISVAPADLLVVLVHRSLDLALRVAAPVLALMSLVTIAFAFLSRALGGRSLVPLESPLRLVMCVVVLALSLSPVAGMAAEGFQSLLETAPLHLMDRRDV
jgi:flagellar biosynthetic protein FliR